MIDRTSRQGARRAGWGPCLALAVIGLGPRIAVADEPAPPPRPPSNGPPGDTPLASAAGPEQITDFDRHAPVPPGYTQVMEPRTGFVIGGAVTLGSAYGATVLTGALTAFFGDLTGNHQDVGPAFLPVVGPFLQLGQTEKSSDQLALLSLGVAQTTGLVLLVYGLQGPRPVLVRNDRLTVTAIAPVITPGASGLSLVGRF
jgi:hypothetical protein